MNVSTAAELPTDARDTVVLALGEDAAVPAEYAEAVAVATERGEVKTRPATWLTCTWAKTA